MLSPYELNITDNSMPMHISHVLPDTNIASINNSVLVTSCKFF